jgi:hypothetical protein
MTMSPCSTSSLNRSLSLSSSIANITKLGVGETLFPYAGSRRAGGLGGMFCCRGIRFSNKVNSDLAVTAAEPFIFVLLITKSKQRYIKIDFFKAPPSCNYQIGQSQYNYNIFRYLCKAFSFEGNQLRCQGKYHITPLRFRYFAYYRAGRRPISDIPADSGRGRAAHCLLHQLQPGQNRPK